MQEKFGMTLSAIYCFVSKNAIPKKKEGIMVYYSKKHVDIAKGIAAPEEPQYYTCLLYTSTIAILESIFTISYNISDKKRFKIQDYRFIKDFIKDNISVSYTHL